ncbi:MAG: response regulator [Phycisphaerae bacterium]|nr:response regulator [Phycisphaerae bacterium]
MANTFNPSRMDIASGSPPRAAPVIVIADDEPAIRLVIARKLQQVGWTVVPVANGEDAVREATAHQPQLVITDLQMPRMDGLCMARQLFSNPATGHIPLILLSARGHRISTHDLTNTNVQHVMLKPFSMRQILAIAQDYWDFTTGDGAASPNAQAA